MIDYRLIEYIPTVNEYVNLRKSVGWKLYEEEFIEKGLRNSLYFICAKLNEEVVGIARVVGDGSICFYIQDVIVKPDFQRRGIGKALMQRILEYIGKNACTGAFIGLMSAKGKELFYEDLGFWKRPDDNFGSGMMKYFEKEQYEHAKEKRE